MQKKTKSFISVFIATLILLVIVGCGSGSSGGGSNEGNGIYSSINSIDSSIKVSLNQIETDCLDPGTEVTAFVTVVDENGNPITVLIDEDFIIIEGTNTLTLDDFDVEYAEQIDIPLSVTLLLDYSGSITKSQDVVDAMEDAAIAFINELTDTDDDGILDKDEVEIIKFATNIEVASQGFTSDKAQLIVAIETPLDVGKYTHLYDSIIEAIYDTAPAPDRKAIIVLTDGKENWGHGSTGPTTVNDVISLAQSGGVPIFTIGLGGRVDENVLAQIADETGGIFYQSANAENLREIYLQLADTLVLNQYVITIYESSLAAGIISNLEIEAEFNAMWDGDWKQFTTCP